MSIFTSIWNLLKKNPATDGNEMFNIETMLNDNWDKIDSALGMKAVNADVRAATIANITLSGLQTVDGVPLAAGDRVLVKNQTAGSENGIYVAGTGQWSRAADANSAGKLAAGVLVNVKEGSANAGTGWILATSGPIELGVTPLTFAQKTGSGSATDAVIGTRTIDDTVMAAAGADTPTRLWSKLANMIKAVTGKANWWTPPATTIEALHSNKLNVSAYTAADVLEKIKTVDGTASGLDADMVDGYHFDQDLRKTAHPTFAGLSTSNLLTDYPIAINVPEGSLDGPIQTNSTLLNPNLNADMVDGFHSDSLMAVRSIFGSGDFNSLSDPGYYKVQPASGTWSGYTNQPPASAYPFGILLVMTDGSAVSQVYQPHNADWGNGLFIRSKFNASDWGAWEQVLTNKLGNVSVEGDVISTQATERSFKRQNSTGHHGFYVNDTRLGAYDWKNSRSIFAYDNANVRWWTNLKFAVESYHPNAMVVGAEGDLGTNNFGLGIAMPAGTPTWPFGIVQGGSMKFTIDGFGNTKAYGFVMTQGAPFVLNRPTVGTTEPWARGLVVRNRNGDVDEAHFGAYGVGDFAPQWLYIAHGDTPWSNGKGIYIDSTGRVGVKKVNPANDLHVMGTIQGQNDGDAFVASRKDNSNLQVVIGYKSTDDKGYIQALSQGTAYKKLALNPDGGPVVTSKNTIDDGTGAATFAGAVTLNPRGTGTNKQSGRLYMQHIDSGGVTHTNTYLQADVNGDLLWVRDGVVYKISMVAV